MRVDIDELRREGAEVVARREQMQRTMQQMREMQGRVVKVQPVASDETPQEAAVSKYSIEELAAEGLQRVAKRKAYAILLEQKLEQLAAKEAAPVEQLADVSESSSDDSQVITTAPQCDCAARPATSLANGGQGSCTCCRCRHCR